jgi:hypothetical protein
LQLVVAAFLGSAVGAACSSGGGGGGGSPGVQVPSSVNYDFSTPSMAMQVEFSGGTLDLLLYLAGVYGIDTEEYTLLPGPLLELDTGELDVACADMVLAVVDERPTIGSLTITQRSSNDLITVAVNYCWVDDPADDTDSWSNGRILIENFISVDSPFMTGGTVLFTE